MHNHYDDENNISFLNKKVYMYLITWDLDFYSNRGGDGGRNKGNVFKMSLTIF